MRALPLSIGTILFVGIGGIGMSGIAEVLHNLGYAVQGSDIADSANVRRLRDAGIPVAVGHDAANLGNAHRARGDFTAAACAFRETVEREPGFADAWSRLGQAERELGNLTAARLAYENALSLKPEEATTRFFLGEVCREQGDRIARGSHAVRLCKNEARTIRARGSAGPAALSSWRRRLAADRIYFWYTTRPPTIVIVG